MTHRPAARPVHFETADYWSREFCIAPGIERFDGGVQAKHKLAQLPAPANLVGVPTATPAFADAAHRMS